VIERAITEEIDIFIDYAKTNRGEVVCSADRLVHARTFIDPKWTANRIITGIAFSEQHPELMAVSYDLVCSLRKEGMIFKMSYFRTKTRPSSLREWF